MRRTDAFHRADDTSKNVIQAVVLPGVFYGNDVAYVFYNTNQGAVAFRMAADRADFMVGNISAYTAELYLFC